ncbi:hypothetical protein ACH5RR_003769 [Cinchona calisaya]|uniref:ATP synthase F0 subunit 6 n=1 Tax=Cinchona calisaya TaxID=153742 RepID=A0ABD3AW83_9GENT
MTFSEPFRAALMIFQETIKLLPKNGKLVALTIVLTLVLSSIFFLIFNFSNKSLLRDMLMRESLIPLTRANSAEFSTLLARLKEDFELMLVIDVAFILAYWFIWLFSIVATILLSAFSHAERRLSENNFILLVLRSWKRPMITGFYTTIMDIGYIFVVFLMASPFIAFFSNSMSGAHLTIYLVGIVACVFYSYLSIVWVLGIVVSVIEGNCYGFGALGKAEELIEGKRIEGFILNAIFVLLSVALSQGSRIIRGHKWLVNDMVYELFLVNFSCLLRLLHFMAYTVLYFQCKKNHGEEIELQGEGGVEYTKIYSTPLVDGTA